MLKFRYFDIKKKPTNADLFVINKGNKHYEVSALKRSLIFIQAAFPKKKRVAAAPISIEKSMEPVPGSIYKKLFGIILVFLLQAFWNLMTPVIYVINVIVNSIPAFNLKCIFVMSIW